MTGKRMVATPMGPLAVRVRGQGPAALLWHSLFVDERSWARVENELGAQRRLILVTGPGHGDSPDPGRRYTLDDCAVSAAAVLDELGVDEPVDWVGNAWGGHVGILFAAGRPERCRTLVTVGAPVQALNRVERARTIALLAAHRLFGVTGLVENGVTTVMLSARTRAEDPAAVALVKDCLSSAGRAALRNTVVSISLRRPDLAPELPKVVAPTLLVTGSEHTGWTPDQADAASAALPDASVAVVADAAYLAPLERPAETARLILEFWATHPPEADHRIRASNAPPPGSPGSPPPR